MHKASEKLARGVSRSGSLKRHLATVGIALVVFGAPVAMAQSGASPNATPGGGGGDPPTATTYYEQNILIRSGETIEALGPNLMGDSISEYSGGVELTQTDTSLPGNNALPVGVARHRALGVIYGGGLFGDWDLEVPRLHSVAAKPEPNWYGAGSTSNFNRCSQFSLPPWTHVAAGGTSLSYYSTSFWDSYRLYVPGVGDQTLLSRNASDPVYSSDPSASSYPIVTKKHWKLSCLSSLENGPGQGFLALAPDGTTYRFDHIAVRPYPHVKVSWLNGASSGIAFIDRMEVWILPTLVTDRFGNWVRYAYTGTDGWRVASITSSDGRSIGFTYNGNGNRIDTVSDGTRTWRYAYASSGSLQTVTQPDGSKWQFALDTLSPAPLSLPDPDCDGDNGTFDSTAQTGTITHPSGAVAAFTLKGTFHGRSNVPGSQATCTYTSNTVSRYFATRSLATKTLSGPGMPPMTWSYLYSLASGSFAPCNGCVATKTVTVTDPLNNISVNTYGTRYGIDEGLLLNSTVSRDSATLQTTAYSYALPNAGPFINLIGTGDHPVDSMNRIYTPQSQRVIWQDGVNFAQTASGFDIYARSLGVTRSNSLGYSRFDSVVYQDYTNPWVLDQVRSRTMAGVEASRTEYDSATALPISTTKFGKLQATYAYNPDGTLYSIKDGLNQITIYTNYMRGLAQKITYADTSYISAVVNNIGTIGSVTNEAGTTWTYGYDAMGRLSSVWAPTGDPVGYNTRYLSFVQVPTPEYGLEANHWRQTITQGNAVTAHYFDARWRKRLTITHDAANPGATQRMQRFDYDPYNRTTFAAYPARSITSIGAATPGVSTVYDALGRPIRSMADSELGTLTTLTDYLTGFQKRVTDPRTYATTTSYQVFDEPSESAITAVTAPESLSVMIARDVFGKPTSITRSGPAVASGPSSVTRSYVYDGNQLLCKTVEPETGATIQLLDAANNLAWRATGLTLTNPSSCDTASVPAASKAGFTYDLLNRLKTTTFGDGSPGITRTYTPDGLAETIVANGSTWNYYYNNRRLLKQENLSFPGGGTWGASHTYDANAHDAQLVYADGTSVDYAPNALGEPTRVGTYATGVSYHPNGAVAGYTLGNGIVHSVSQNTRGLPSLNADAGVMRDAYSYDANGNIASIVDQQEGITNRSMAYDGLDRLTVANAPGVWGNASYTYDALGNLRTSVVGSRNSTHNYDAKNRLASISAGLGYTAYAYDVQGNVTARGSKGYYFDQGNRLQLANGVASYSYDGLGRRVMSYAANGSTRWQMYGQSGKLLFDQALVNGVTTQTRYVYLGSKVIAENSSVSGVIYMHTDALGSPVARTNAAAGLLSRTRYEPYGNTAAGTVPNNDIGFTGHVNDAGTGLVYMQQRYYDPMAARFMSVDPITTDANTGTGFNPYEYAQSNPYRYTDPDGRYSSCGQYVQGCTTIWINPGSGPGWGARAGVEGKGAASSGSGSNAVLLAANTILPEDEFAGRAAREPIRGPANVAEARANLAAARAETAAKTGEPLLGENPRAAGTRTNTDLPGDRATAKSIFRNQTRGQDVTQTTISGGGVRRTAGDGTQIRMNANGTTRLDLPGRGPLPNGETIHIPPQP